MSAKIMIYFFHVAATICSIIALICLIVYSKKIAKVEPGEEEETEEEEEDDEEEEETEEEEDDE